jgi:hypothetical protein
MYSNIQDCDEGRFLCHLTVDQRPLLTVTQSYPVFNFFEPLHYFTYNSGFQTWELSPDHAIRSWAYILPHWPLAHLAPLALKIQKVSR